MKKANKIIVIIVFLLIIAFGVGQFFAFSNPTAITGTNNQTTSTATSTGPAAPATEVVAYAPPQPASSTPVENGSCWTNSIAAAARADAWRCSVGNGISDPCFALPGSTSTLLCGMNPAKPDGSASTTFVLKLTKPLPAPVAAQGLPAVEQVWLVQLADGTLCSPFTGTRPYTATYEAANYGCAPGPLGKDVMIFGDLNASSSVWTAEIGTLSTPTSSLPVITASSTVNVAKVWE